MHILAEMLLMEAEKRELYLEALKDTEDKTH